MQPYLRRYPLLRPVVDRWVVAVAEDVTVRAKNENLGFSVPVHVGQGGPLASEAVVA